MEMLKQAMISALAATMLCGCTYQAGQPPLDRAKVAQIQKGVTTREQVEAILGPPTSLGLGNDGERIALYMSWQLNSPGPDAAMFIPIVGPYVSRGPETTQRQQMLQILYTTSGVVKDYEFQDTASQTRTKLTPFSTKTEMTPTAPVKN